MDTKRNGALGFWSFVFCMVIVVHYAYFLDPQKAGGSAFFFSRGEIAFDFFFILAGVLLAKSVNAIPEESTFVWSDTWSFLKAQLRRYLPGLTICWVVGFAVINKICWVDMKTLFNNFFAAGLELLPIRAAGFSNIPSANDVLVGNRVMDQAWALSAVMLAFLVLYPLYLSNRKRFEYYIAPVGAALLMCFLFFRMRVLTTDNLLILDAKNKNLYFFTPGTYKAFGEILAGVACYTAVRHFSRKEISKGTAHLLSLVELGCYLLPIVYMQFMDRFGVPKRFDYLMVGFMLLGIAISLSGKSSLSKLCDSGFFIFLGRFSLYPFLTFILFAKTLPYFLPDMGIRKLSLVYVGLTLVSAAVLMLIEKPFVKLLKAMKRLFVKPQALPKEEAA